MTARSRMPALALGLAMSVAAVSAHHSIAGVYDTSRQVNVEGVMARFGFVNPHPFLEINVTSGGQAQLWTLELDNRYELVDIGVTNETFKPGDRVVVSGNPSHKQGQRLYVRRLERPSDGMVYEQRGQRPVITKKP